MKRQGVSHQPVRRHAWVARTKRAHLYLSEEIWEESREPRSPTLRVLRRLARIVYLASHGFRADRCVFRASALTYVTVLSLVPLLALSFSVAKGVGAFDTLKEKIVDPFLDENLVALETEPAPDAVDGGSEPSAAEDPLPAGSEAEPRGAEAEEDEASTAGGEAIDSPSATVPGAAEAADADASAADARSEIDAIVELRSTIEKGLKVVEETDFKALGFTGLVLLLYAVIKMLGTVEGSLNDIWGVQRSRTLVRKVSDYTTMVVVTPMLVLIALALTTAAQDNSLVAWCRDKLHLGPVFDVLLKSAPLAAVWCGFAFLYLALPNTKTRLGSSLLGGIVGGTLWQLAQLGHVKFQLGMASHSAVYAGFAAVPIFLVWVQVSWITVLAGAQVAYAHQNEQAYRRTRSAVPRDHAFRELLALRVAVRVGAAFLSGARPWTSANLGERLDVPGRELEEVLRPLVAGGILAESGESPGIAYLPARDLESIRAVDVLDALKGKVGPVVVPGDDVVDRRVAELLGELDSELAGSAANRTLAALARAALRQEERAGREASEPVRALEAPTI